jgi:hypothetical protein
MHLFRRSSSTKDRQGAFLLLLLPQINKSIADGTERETTSSQCARPGSSTSHIFEEEIVYLYVGVTVACEECTRWRASSSLCRSLGTSRKSASCPAATAGSSVKTLTMGSTLTTRGTTDPSHSRSSRERQPRSYGPSSARNGYDHHHIFVLYQHHHHSTRNLYRAAAFTSTRAS